MKKLQLNLDQLRVERFETISVQEEVGTVLGHAPTRTAVCGSCFVDSCVTGAQNPCPYCP